MVTPDQATRAFTLFAFSEAAKLRGQQMTVLHVRPGCAESAEAALLLDRWGVVFLTCDIETDEATPRISVGESVIDGLAGLKQMGPDAFRAPVAERRAAAPAADKEVRELLASLAERASAIAARTTIALRLGEYARQGEGISPDSIHDIGHEVGSILEVMDRLAALGAVPPDVARMGAGPRHLRFGSSPDGAN